MNLGLEFGLARKWTLDVPVNYNPWKPDNGRRLRHWGIQPEIYSYPSILYHTLCKDIFRMQYMHTPILRKGDFLHIDIDFDLKDVKVKSTRGVDFIPQLVAPERMLNLPKQAQNSQQTYSAIYISFHHDYTI